MPWGGNQQQGGAQTPHPTVPYGQDGQQGYGGQQAGGYNQQPNNGGFQGGQPQQGGQQQGGYVPQNQQGGTGFPFQGQQQAAPPVQPHPTAPFGQEGVQPQGQPQGQPQQPQQPRGVQLNDDTILDGPNVPTELRGRTFGQVKSIYTALASDWLTRQRAGQNGQMPQVQTPGQAQPQPQGQPRITQGQQPQGQPQGDGGWDWSNPRESIAGVVRDVVSESLGPVIQHTQGNAVSQARAVAMQQIPDFQQLEGEIMQKVANLSPQVLAQPAVWINAARLARGEAMERGNYNFPRNQPNGGQPQQHQNGGVPQPQPFTRSPAVPAQPYQFFTESPTPPSGDQFGGNALSQQEIHAAQAMGMTPEQYIHWRGGVQR